MYLRHITDAVRTALTDTPVVLVVGPRQAGKSTLVQSLVKSHESFIGAEIAGNGSLSPVQDQPAVARYITLDNPAVLAVARQDPVSFVDGLTESVVIDEVQRAPELFLPLKASVDRDRRPGRFLLTGSANVLTLPQVADALVGRIEVIHLWPLSQGELIGVRERFLDALFAADFELPTGLSAGPNRQELLEIMLRGGYPEAVARSAPARRRAFFQAYVNTLLSRDVRDLLGISDVSRLAQLIVALASRVGGGVNTEDLSRTLGIPATTLRRYLDLLEVIFVVTRLPAWAVNIIGVRVIKSPKLYMTDTGLLADQLGVTTERMTRDPTLVGALLENFVVTELQKQASWNPLAPKLFHYRESGGREVDIVLEAPDGRVVGVEVKATGTLGAKEFANLRQFADKVGDRFVRGIILYGGTEAVAFAPNLYALPVHSLWATWERNT